MNGVERVLDCTTLKKMLNELYSGFGCAVKRTPINAVCHTLVLTCWMLKRYQFFNNYIFRGFGNYARLKSYSN